MSLKFFVDHCVPQTITDLLRSAGHETLRLRDHIPHDSADALVIATAQQLVAILVSVNGDFSDIVTYPPAKFQGIVALQIRNHPEIIPQLMDRLLDYLSAHPQSDHFTGKLFLIEVHRIRIRE